MTKRQRIKQDIYLAKSQNALGAGRDSALDAINKEYNLAADDTDLRFYAISAGRGGIDYWN